MTFSPLLLCAVLVGQGGSHSDVPPDGTRPRLLILNLQAAGVEEATNTVITGLVSQGLSRSTSLEVITANDLGALTDLEAERQASGCDSASCLAEIADAMGARFVLFGTAGRLGDVIVVQLNVFDSEAARPIGREEARAADEAGLLDTVPAAARKVVRTIVAPDDPLLMLDGPRGVAAAEAPPDANGLGILPLSLFLGGGGLAAASAVIAGVGVAAFAVATLMLSDTSGSVSAALKNNVYKPLGPAGAVAGAVGVVAVLVGAAVATAGFFVE